MVYNHFGPEGNVLGNFGPYFTDKHQTPWGSAINFDGPGSDAVRNFFLENAMMWLQDYHIDALGWMQYILYMIILLIIL